VAAGEAILNRANIPTFPYPDTAARMFDYMVRYAESQHSLYETPGLGNSISEPDFEHAAKIIKTVRDAGRTILTEYESKQLLSAYRIPTVDTRIALTEEEAVANAEAIGYPVVLKLYSLTITHKTDVGGVQLNLADAKAVSCAFNAIKTSVADKVGAQHFQGATVQPMAKLDGYELIIGSSIDPQFGPVLLFGMGGQLVEVFKDRALAIPPLTTTLARQMMERTQIYKALKGVRGRKSVDLDALEQLLVRFGQLVTEQRFIKELDINPLLASPDHLIALDARVVVFEPEVTKEQLPKPAIRAYPNKYVTPWTASDGTPLTIRPIRPEDEPMTVKFHTTLSDRSVYQRFLRPMLLSDRVRHDRLARICHCDYDREMTLVAEMEDKAGEHVILGVGRLSKLHGLNAARFSMIISDDFQRRGLDAEIMRRLIQVARDEKLDHIEAIITNDNQAMQRLCGKLGARLTPQSDGKVKAEIDL
jgi:acetyltransferase